MASSTSDQYDLNDEHQVWLQICSKLVPGYFTTFVTEALYQLKKAGIPFQMYPRWFRTHKYIIIGLDLEKISGAGFTGMNTKAGDLLILNSRDCADGVNGNIPTRVLLLFMLRLCIEHQRFRCRGYGLMQNTTL